MVFIKVILLLKHIFHVKLVRLEFCSACHDGFIQFVRNDGKEKNELIIYITKFPDTTTKVIENNLFFRKWSLQ